MKKISRGMGFTLIHNPILVKKRILSEFQLLGAACVGLVAYYMDHGRYTSVNGKAELFYLLVAVACLVGTFCLVTSCIVSMSTASIISKTVYVSKI